MGKAKLGVGLEESTDGGESGNNRQAIGSEVGIQASSVGQSLSYNVSSGVDDNVKLESVLEEGETIMESDLDSSRKDVNVAVVASNGNDSSESAQTEASLDKDSKIESNPKDLEMGLDP